MSATRRHGRPELQRLSAAAPATDTANMLAYGLVRAGRVADTRQKRPIFVNLETGQEVGRSRPAVANTCRSLVLVAYFGVFSVVRRLPILGGAARRRPLLLQRPARGGELVASIRSEPATYNRYTAAGAAAATDVVTFLTQARLVRVNRATDELEPWLAESWTSSPDGLTHTITLRPGIRFSDGEPFTSADVLFSFRAAYDPAVGEPARFGAHGPRQTSRGDRSGSPARWSFAFPKPFAPGLRLLDSLPILPRHKLEPALNGKQFQNAWVPSKPVDRRRRPRTVSARRARRGTTSRLRAQPALLPARRRRSPAAVPRPPDARHRSRSEHRGAAARSVRERPHEQRRHPAAGPRRVQAARGPGAPANDRRQRRARSRLPLVQPAAGAARRAPGAMDRAQGVQAGDLVRRRSPGDRQHRLPGRRGTAVRAGHARQPTLVLGRRAGMPDGSRARAGSSWQPRA